MRRYRFSCLVRGGVCVLVCVVIPYVLNASPFGVCGCSAGVALEEGEQRILFFFAFLLRRLPKLLSREGFGLPFHLDGFEVKLGFLTELSLSTAIAGMV